MRTISNYIPAALNFRNLRTVDRPMITVSLSSAQQKLPPLNCQLLFPLAPTTKLVMNDSPSAMLTGDASAVVGLLAISRFC